MTKEDLKNKVEEVIQAGSCCPELKEAGKKYLDAYGTDDETECAKQLIAELKDDVNSVDSIINLCNSDQGKKIFGEEKAAGMAKAAEESKKKGNKYCICDACQAGGVILDNQDLLLN